MTVCPVGVKRETRNIADKSAPSTALANNENYLTITSIELICLLCIVSFIKHTCAKSIKIIGNMLLITLTKHEPQVDL